MQRPDLRQIAGNIREALADCDRDTLLDMLTFVFKEYVVEGPPPLLVSQTERIADLEGLSFAELVRTLQARLDLPELGQLQVEGAQVLVRVNGVLTPIDAGAGRATAPAAAPPMDPAAAAAAAMPPGVRVVETQLSRRPPPAGSQPGAPPAQGQGAPGTQSSTQAPPPRGMSLRGRPSGEGAAPAPAAPAAPTPRSSAPAPQAGAAPPQPAPASREPAPPGDSDAASERFSLLELD